MIKQRYEWVDIMKAVAILAVILNHTVGLIFESQLILLHTGFSVTLFIFLSGITSSISISNKEEVNLKYLWNRLKSPVASYIVASFVYHVFVSNYRFDFIPFINQILTFSASPPFYFFAFYFQLVLCSTILYKIINYKKSFLYHVAILIIILIVSNYLTTHTLIGNIMGGGGNLLGGTYLFVYSLGITLHIYLHKLTGYRTNLWGLLLFAAFLALFEYKDYIQLIWSNPPNKYLLVYTLLVFGLIFSMYQVMSRFKSLTLLKIISYVGSYSLFIFMYHTLFIDLSLKYNMLHMLGIQNIYLTRIWILFCSIIMPVVVGVITKQYLKPSFKKLVFYTNNKSA